MGNTSSDNIDNTQNFPTQLPEWFCRKNNTIYMYCVLNGDISKISHVKSS